MQENAISKLITSFCGVVVVAAQNVASQLGPSSPGIYLGAW